MKKRAKLCLYIFLVLSFVALGILGYFIFNNSSDNVMTGSRKFVTFNTVKNATSYSVQVDDDQSASYVVQKNEVKDKDNCFNFVVSVSKGDKKVAEEHYLQEINNEYLDTNKIDCKIKNYTIIFFDEEQKEIEDKKVEYVDQELKGVDKDVFCVVVSEYFEDVFVLDGTYSIICTPFANNKEIKDDSGNSLAVTEKIDYRAYYKKDFLRRGEYFYGGKWYDYVIDSLDELKAFVWRTILYRGAQKGETFYVNTNKITKENINDLVSEAIESYPEYNGLNYNAVWATMRERIGSLANFSYYLPENFLKTNRQLDMTKLSLENQAIVQDSVYELYENVNIQYVTGDVSEENTGERHFAIDKEREDATPTIQDKRRNQSGKYVASEVVVYNTEQLFMVVQGGGRPVFIEGKSDVAQKVYQKALEVLRKINNADNLTEYEKALNIYNYLTGEIVYDNVIYTYMEKIGSFLVSDFGEYSCFYLEGVFYDFDDSTTHYAVCDGLAKAYSLLCNIEGIKCEKVNGRVNGKNQSGEDWENHAWNKVCLQEDSSRELEAGNYYVDCTWGEGRFIEESEESIKKYQILTHSYFLFKHDETERKIDYPIFENDDSLQYDYYKNTKIDCVVDGETIQVDLYVENSDNLENLIVATFERDKKKEETKYIEMKIDSNFKNRYKDFGSYLASTINKLMLDKKIDSIVGYKYFMSSNNLLFLFVN